MILYLVSLLLTLLYIWYKLKIRKFEKYAKALPGGHFYTPLGDFQRLLVTMNYTTDQVMKELDGIIEKHQEDGIMKVWMLHWFGVIVWRHDYAEAVGTNPDTARKGRIFDLILGDIVKGLLVDEGTPEIKDLRTPILNMMRKKYIDNHHHSGFLKHSNKMAERLKNLENKNINIRDEAYRTAFELFCETGLGINQSPKVEELSPKFLDTVCGILYEKIRKISMVWPFLIRSIFLLLDNKKTNWVFGGVSWIINYRRKKIKECATGDFEYFIDPLIKRAVRKNIEESVLEKEILEGIVAGTATTSITVSSLVVFLAMHPELQEAIYEEQVRVLGEELRDPTPEDLVEMEHLNRAIMETLRLTTVPFMHKQATAEVKLGEYLIPKDTYIIVLIRQLHRNPLYWEKPQGFCPEHFLPDRVRNRPDYAYLPFGLGVRRCPGQRYARPALTVLASALVRNFKFSTKWKLEDLQYEINVLCGFKRMFYDVTFENRRGKGLNGNAMVETEA